jgi:asparagine synthase (glutamine-hydrolysing)
MLIARKKRLARLLDSSVQQRMVADVPLGCFLSGGLDSSIIATLASRHTQKLKTFSVGFADEKYFDETKYAQLVAKKIKSDHHVFELSNRDLFEELHQVMEETEEPFADSSALAVYLLSKHTRKEVTVALSGDGADELFGGYNKHQAELRARSGGVTNAVARLMSGTLSLLPSSRNSSRGNKIRQLKKFAEGLKLPPNYRYWRWAGFTGGSELHNLLGPVPKGASAYHGRFSALTKEINEDLNSVLYTDMKLVLEGDMLVKTDRMSMANSLEVRVPFLDRKLVDLVNAMPVSYKVQKGNGKKILRETFTDILPQEILTRKKQGFEIPLLSWLRKELGPMIEVQLSEKKIKEQGIFNYKEVKEITRQLFSTDPGDAPARIWALLVFQDWWDRNME